MVETPVEVLVIDDNPNDVELTVHALKRAETIHNIQVARDGVEALDFIYCTGPFLARTPTNLPRLILLDLKLPKIDGWGVLQRLKSDPATQNIPVVVLTSSSDHNDVAKCYRFGANSYIIKPVDFSEFIETARIMGTYWMSLNYMPSP